MHEYYTLKQAVELIIDRANKPNDKTQRGWDNLIRARLNRAIPKPKGISKTYSFDELLAHARNKYGAEPFADLPAHNVTVAVNGVIEVMLQGDFCEITALAFSVPNNLEECKNLISELHAGNSKLKQEMKKEIKKRDDEIERLKPLAEQYLKNCATNQSNAKKSRHS